MAPSLGVLPTGPSVRREATATFGYHLAALAAGALTNIVIARTLGPEGKGILSLLGYALFVSTSLGALGLQTASVQMIGKGRFLPGEVSIATGILSLATGLAAGLGMWLLLPRFRGTVPIEPILVVSTAVLVIPAMVRQNVTGVLLGLGRIGIFNLTHAVPSFLWAAAASILLLGLGGDVRDAALAWILVQLAGAGLGIGASYAAAPPRPRRTRACARALLGFGLPAYAAGLAWILVLRIDSFLLAAFRSAAEVGIYSVAVLIAEVVLHIPRSLTQVLNPRFASGETVSAARLASRASKAGSFPVLLVSIAIGASAWLLIPAVFGEEFAGSIAPLIWLLPGVLAIAIASPFVLYLVQQQGKPTWTGIAAGVALAVNVGLNLLLIPRHGVLGAAWASSIAYGVHAAVVVALFRRASHCTWKEVFVPVRRDLDVWTEGFRKLRRPPRGGS